MKKIPFLMLILLLSLSVYAQNQQTRTSRVIDNAGLLNSAQISSLESLIASVAAMYDFDLVILTEMDIGDLDPGEWADYFFDQMGFGLGQYRDGSLFLQVYETRDYWFSQSGRGLGILNGTAYSKLDSDTVRFLSQNNPYEAYRAFILAWDEFLALDAVGRSYNFFHRWNAILVTISWVLALAIGLCVVGFWKRGMNTALAQTHSDAYVVPNSLAFSEKNDNFLYSNVTKTKRQTESSSTSVSSPKRSSRGRGGKY